MSTKFQAIALSVVAMAGFFAMVPVGASADTATCGWFWGTNNQSCGTGTVLTYVQVMNRYNTNYTPSNFIVDARGQNPSLPSFPGSLQGTLITLTAQNTYSMVLENPQNFDVQYSTGCNGTVYANTQALCVITVSTGPGYNAHPTPYPYPYTLMPLTCTPQYQSTGAGQTATFVALGGAGTYNWKTIDSTFLGTGPVLNTTFSLRGTQSVTVSSGTQTATCTVDVGGTGPIVYSGVSNATYPVTSLTITAQPTLPNTGFAPLGATEMAVALATLIGLGLLASPYVRKLSHIALS